MTTSLILIGLASALLSAYAWTLVRINWHRPDPAWKPTGYRLTQDPARPLTAAERARRRP